MGTINLFAKTEHRFAEEDRLTNAFMALLDHANPSTQEVLLSQLCGERIVLMEDDEVLIDLQVTFMTSRPDARIRWAGHQVIIETKLGTKLDPDQFKRHWEHITTTSTETDPVTILLGLTESRTTPPIIDTLNAEANTSRIIARHLSWSHVLKALSGLKGSASRESATGLLLHQLEAYLRHLGYFYLEGSIVTPLQRYGRLLSELHKLKDPTEARLTACLDCLHEAIMSAPDMIPLAWSKKNFGRNAVSEQRVHFTFLTAPLDGLDGAYYRVLPSMDADGELSLTYYFTYNHRGRPTDGLAGWLTEHVDEIKAAFPGLTRCGPVSSNKPYIFHIARRLDGRAGGAFFSGDESSIAELGVEIGAFFQRTQAWIDQGLSHQSSDGGPVSS